MTVAIQPQEPESVLPEIMHVTNFSPHKDWTDARILAMKNHGYWCAFNDPPSSAGACDCPLRSERRRLLLGGTCEHCGSTGDHRDGCRHSTFMRGRD